MCINKFSFSKNCSLAVRETDNAVFQPSYPNGYGEAEAIAEIVSGRMAWFFRRIVPVPRKWWHFRAFWRRTGETWAVFEPRLFKVVKADEAWRIANGK